MLEDIFRETYKGKKVFITGHTGFKGSWLLYWFSIIGADVKGYALEPEPERLFNQIKGEELCQSVIGNVLDRNKLRREVLDFSPDFIFHLAAQPLVRLSYDIPVETFSTNVIGTANILDVLRELDHPCVCVLITTDKVYENKEWTFPYRENDVLGGKDPYSASKACAELAISSYRSSFFNPADYKNHGKSVASARAGNVIGGGDWAKDRIFPDIVRALHDSKPVILRNPSAIRPWQHVLESLAGYLSLGQKMKEDPMAYSEAFNFGPYLEDTLTVEALATNILDVWGNGSYEKASLTNQPHEAGILKLDISKTIARLNWRPAWKAKKAIEITTHWYKGFYNNIAPRSLMEKDVMCYLESVDKKTI